MKAINIMISGLWFKIFLSSFDILHHELDIVFESSIIDNFVIKTVFIDNSG